MLLKKGDNNEQVKQLQIKLGVDPVGNFGPKTEEAVKKYQAANGLAADGIVGDGTWSKLFPPVTSIAGGTNWKQVSAGEFNCMAVTSGTDPTFFIS
jgi:peptidoglycan hydrolase-like protein with peptidoglycan-binding domain